MSSASASAMSVASWQARRRLAGGCSPSMRATSGAVRPPCGRGRVAWRPPCARARRAEAIGVELVAVLGVARATPKEIVSGGVGCRRSFDGSLASAARRGGRRRARRSPAGGAPRTSRHRCGPAESIRRFHFSSVAARPGLSATSPAPCPCRSFTAGQAVELADDDRQRPTGAARALELQLEKVLEGAAVEQAGESVGAARLASDRSSRRPDAAIWRRRRRTPAAIAPALGRASPRSLNEPHFGRLSVDLSRTLTSGRMAVAYVDPEANRAGRAQRGFHLVTRRDHRRRAGAGIAAVGLALCSCSTPPRR